MKKKVIPILVMGIVFSLMIVFELFSIKFSSIFFILIGGGIGILVECIREVISKKKEADDLRKVRKPEKSPVISGLFSICENNTKTPRGILSVNGSGTYQKTMFMAKMN